LGLHIPPRHPEVAPWTKAQKAWIGQLPREEIARRTGRSLEAVSRQERLVRPDLFPHRRRDNGKAWRPDEARLLGTKNDKALAGQLERTPRAVANKRRKLHIPAVKAERPGFVWTPVKDAMLQTHSDHALERLWRTSARGLRKRRQALGIPPAKCAKKWTTREVRMLWRFNNRKIAQRTGRTLASINEQRQVRGAPPSRAVPGFQRRLNRQR
jgi:hypothetical protein